MALLQRITPCLWFDRAAEGAAQLYTANRLGAGGNERAQQCGWLKDRFGLSWQVVQAILPRLLADPDPAKAQRVMAAVLQMKKIEIAPIERAYAG